jgi:hypothetical protein
LAAFSRGGSHFSGRLFWLSNSRLLLTILVRKPPVILKIAPKASYDTYCTNDKEGKAKTVIMMPLSEQPSEANRNFIFFFFFYQGNLKTLKYLPMSKSGYP